MTIILLPQREREAMVQNVKAFLEYFLNMKVNSKETFIKAAAKRQIKVPIELNEKELFELQSMKIDFPKTNNWMEVSIFEISFEIMVERVDMMNRGSKVFNFHIKPI